jgi:hypothetical protein
LVALRAERLGEANERRLDPRKSALLAPVLSLRQSDVSPPPRKRFAEVTIPLYYEGHVAVRGVNVPTGLPPCPGFRGEPCRSYQQFVNRPTSP